MALPIKARDCDHEFEDGDHEQYDCAHEVTYMLIRIILVIMRHMKPHTGENYAQMEQNSPHEEQNGAHWRFLVGKP